MQIVSTDKKWDGRLPQSLSTELLQAVDRVRQVNKSSGTTAMDNTLIVHGTAIENKMAAAALIGKHLERTVYRVDTHALVSKYIGETEKNIDAVFVKGNDTNAILFFDEADALFVKRTEVKDSHDRYQNIELNYLLQKIQQYPNFIILGTDNKEQVSPTYIKYFKAIVHLP